MTRIYKHKGVSKQYFLLNSDRQLLKTLTLFQPKNFFYTFNVRTNADNNTYVIYLIETNDIICKLG